ncbi:histidine--tRNA ligase [Legionella micdadei]|uniref:Histidine--tRNA ligase n=2 Tax=Legionella micdadei TaxID=451 RepID=A0A098GE97_LEGMI|nr:histidine--tRNA ligase [Legionella micdadei]ARG97629.1 histidine--tRNA ligase [Legionella micdadei]ARH00057.1 histidine--tRNA ligase [Legionella micdadei]KTD27716.1 histidyl-tRNA synthetase [Legionella micdadei]NSL17701.1 histidine--tRNA ligase [Legionella micdadei]CEG60798.1 Histidyl-tRNA synthetase [Legionella micdadei]
MAEKIQAIRGMNDILPQQTPSWRRLEELFTRCLLQYGYEEIRFPLLESTLLFKRTIGEVTDIVEKEMYTFDDLNGDSLTLRPEGTAGCLRACLEHGLLHNQQQKLWYMGPMFRHEKPQKGRYRQFYQLGVEALGIAGEAVELELIAICKRLWTVLGIDKEVHLQINTLGELSERQVYREKLIAYFKLHFDELDEDSKRRLERNPMRILDSKNPEMQALINDAPRLMDSLGVENRKRFSHLCEGLTQLGIPFSINPFLVRGLDYYGHTVFEWVTDKLGSQATVCAGGRYDALVEHLGGNPTPAVGFAMGAERLLLLLETLGLDHSHVQTPSVFIIASGDVAMQKALMIAEQLRNANPNWQVITNTVGGGFKSQFRKADKSGAGFALILGEDEVADGTISVKNLRQQEEQVTILQEDLIGYLQNGLASA